MSNLYFTLFVAYIVSPKIDLPILSASVRPEDIISLITFLIYALSKKQHRLQLPGYVKIYIAFIGLSYFSAIINFGSNGLLGFLYTTRLIQYLLWFFVMYEACQSLTWQTVRRGVMLMCVVFIIWAGLELSGAIGRIGRFTGASGRLSINTSGPFETSVMLAMLGYSVPSILLTAPMLVLILLTQARITLMGMIFSAGVAKPLRAIFAGAVAVLVFTVVAQPIIATFQESRVVQSDSPTRMAEVLVESWKRAPTLDEPAVFRERFLDGPSIFRYMVSLKGDMSFSYRAVRWPMVIKTTSSSLMPFLFGWSPGAWGLALDGYYVRVFGETGLLGLALFIYWLMTTIFGLRQGSISKFALVMMAVVAVFIDIFTSSKVMPILWAFLALDHARHPFAMPRRTWPSAPDRVQRSPAGR